MNEISIMEKDGNETVVVKEIQSEYENTEVDIDRTYVLGSQTMYEESMDLANESLTISNNIELPMEGNIQGVKESLEQQMRNNIGTCDKSLEGDLYVIGDKRFVVSTGKLKELKGTHCCKLSNDGSICDKKTGLLCESRRICLHFDLALLKQSYRKMGFICGSLYQS